MTESAAINLAVTHTLCVCVRARACVRMCVYRLAMGREEYDRVCVCLRVCSYVSHSMQGSTLRHVHLLALLHIWHLKCSRVRVKPRTMDRYECEHTHTHTHTCQSSRGVDRSTGPCPTVYAACSCLGMACRCTRTESVLCLLHDTHAGC